MRRSPRFAFSFFASLALTAFALAAKLEPYSSIQNLRVRECSGIVKSRLSENLYWVHNDSSGGSNLFSIRKDGSIIGTFATGLRNIDWEDIATDNSGNLYIGDFGNFENVRKDLAIHVVKESASESKNALQSNFSIRFEFPDQTGFPPPRRIFDCEALFWANDHLFILTKTLGDTATRLYRFNDLDPNSINQPELIGKFDIGPQVTGADASPDGSKLAVLTTRSLWVFERPADTDNYLAGDAKTTSIQAGQCEAVCWDSPSELIIANESRALYSITLDSLAEY